MRIPGRSLVGSCRQVPLGVLAVVAAATVGFAVGDALAAPRVKAATIAARSQRGTVEQDWSWRLARGKTIEIEGVNGSIHARGSDGAEVVVQARKHARRSDPDEVTIEVLEHADGITLCVHYPDTRGHRNRCAPHGRSRMNVDDNDVQVDFEVQVPAGVHFVGRMVNGDVVGRALPAEGEAYTVNGSVELETRGRSQAKTVNGSIRARLGTLRGSGSLSFRTVNGSVTVILPEDANVEVLAKNLNGRIETEFPLYVRHSRWGVGNRLDGTIGGGGPHLEMETVNGTIHLLRGGSL